MKGAEGAEGTEGAEGQRGRGAEGTKKGGGGLLSFFAQNGAYERNRTGDLFLTKEVLYLLSYVGAKTGCSISNSPTPRQIKSRQRRSDGGLTEV